MLTTTICIYLLIGTGIYQILLLVVCGLVNMSCAISTTAVSFISPAAEVDFDLSSTAKGILNGAPFLGKSLVYCIVLQSVLLQICKKQISPLYIIEYLLPSSKQFLHKTIMISKI